MLQADGTSNANILNMVGVALGGLSINVGDLISAEPGTGAAETVDDQRARPARRHRAARQRDERDRDPGADRHPAAVRHRPDDQPLDHREATDERAASAGRPADTAQVALAINGDIALVATVLGLPVTGTTAISVNVARRAGTLTDIICGSETAARPER